MRVRQVAGGTTARRQTLRVQRRKVKLRVITHHLSRCHRCPRASTNLVNAYGAEVRINYEINRTRLHAKAWMLGRNTGGFNTAYVGSSEPLPCRAGRRPEWNVRLLRGVDPAPTGQIPGDVRLLLGKPRVRALPTRRRWRQTRALEVAAGKKTSASSSSLSGLEVQPKPYQAEMPNNSTLSVNSTAGTAVLIVAATGTGKTVVAALTTAWLRHAHDRDPSLLLVAHRKEILVQARRMYQEVQVLQWC